MQHLVPVIAGVHQTLCCAPHLRRFVCEKLVGNDLVHRQVEGRVHGSAMMVDLFSSGLDRRTQLGMLGENQHRAVMLVIRIEETQFDAIELATEGRHGEQSPVVIAHPPNATDLSSTAFAKALCPKRAAALPPHALEGHGSALDNPLHIDALMVVKGLFPVAQTIQ